MYETTHDLDLKALLARRWRAIGLTFVLVMASGTAILTQAPKRYQVSSKLLVMRADQRMGGMKIINDVIPELSQSSRPVYTQVELLRVLPLFKQVIERLDLKGPDGNPLHPEQLAGRVKVAPIKDTDLIEVTYTDSDPLLAQKVLAAIGEAFLELGVQYRRDGVSEGVKIVDEQLAATRKHLIETEDRFASFKRASGTIALDQEIEASVQDKTDMERQRRALQTTLESARARAESLRARLGMSEQEALWAVSLAQSPRIKALQDQLIAAESSPLLSSDLGRDNPELTALRQRIAFLKGRLDSEIKVQIGTSAQFRNLDEVQVDLLHQLTAAEADRRAAEASLKVLIQSHDMLSVRMAELPGRETQFARLAQEVEVARRMYQDLLQKREEARLNLAISPTNVRIVQRPEVPTRPLAPLGSATIPVLFIAGLASAFSVGFLKDMRERATQPQVLADSLPDHRILGVLPTLTWSERRKGELLVTRDGSPHYLEALNSLGLALDTQLTSPNGRLVALTSSTMGEGKSVTLANLAYCLAEAGHRVLLVDGDLRRPRLHSILGLPNDGPGFGECLTDACSPREAVRKAGAIDVVLAGNAPVKTKRMALKRGSKEVFEAWQSAYDYVLLDLPPMELFSEVAQCARNADGLLVLAKLDRVEFDSLRSGIQRMQDVGIPVLGLVALSPAVKANARYYLGEGGRA